MPTNVTITNLTGSSPYNVWVCDTTLTTCIYVSTFSTVPYTFEVPYVYSSLTDFITKSDKGPGGVKKLSPETFTFGRSCVSKRSLLAIISGQRYLNQTILPKICLHKLKRSLSLRPQISRSYEKNISAIKKKKKQQARIS